MSFNVAKAQPGIGSQFDSLITQASGTYSVPVALIKAIISQESAWNPAAVNPSDPSYGLMQLNSHYWTINGQPILDPAANIDTGTRFLAQLLGQYGPDLSQVISAYNAGHPITGNAPYVQDVLAYYNWFQLNDPLLQTGGGVLPGDGSIPGWPSDKDLQLILGIVVGIGLLIVALKR